MTLRDELIAEIGATFGFKPSGAANGHMNILVDRILDHMIATAKVTAPSGDAPLWLADVKAGKI